jgi:hypothetical protein
MKKLGCALAALVLAFGGLSSAHADTETEYREFADRVGDDLRARSFEVLGREADRFLTERSRMSDGRWKLAMFYRAVAGALPEIMRSKRRKEEFESALTNYAKSHPASQMVPLLMAQAAEAIGFEARGGGYADTVTPQGWRDFGIAMDGARAVLEANRKRLATNPEWYTLRMEVAIYRNESQASIKALFDEGVRREPAYLPLYQTMQLNLSPQWHGSNRQLMDFVNEAGHNSPAAASEGLYARLVWNASPTYAQIELDPRLDWPAMRAGMDAVVAHYPAERNVQKFFLIACSHPDKEEARKLFSLIHEAPSREVLGSNVPIFGLCQEWAAGKIKMFIMRNPDTGEERIIK